MPLDPSLRRPQPRRRRSQAAPGRSATGRFARAADDQARLPRLARFRRARSSTSPTSLRDDDAARRGPGDRPPRHRPLGDRLCRPPLRHPAAPRCASSCSRSTARSATSSPGLDRAGHRLCRDADRRPWRPRSARARPRSRAAATPPASIPRSTPTRWARRSAARLGLQRPGPARRRPVRRHVRRPRPARARPARRVLAEAVARLSRPSPGRRRLHPRRDRGDARARPARPTPGRLLQRARASFDAERSGDFYVMLKPADHADRRRQPAARSPPMAAPGTMTGGCRSCSGGAA